MKCEICNQGPPDGPSIYRVNQLGVPGVWRCEQHLTAKQREEVPADVLEIIKAIENKPGPEDCDG